MEPYLKANPRFSQAGETEAIKLELLTTNQKSN